MVSSCLSLVDYLDPDEVTFNRGNISYRVDILSYGRKSKPLVIKFHA